MGASSLCPFPCSLCLESRAENHQEAFQSFIPFCYSLMFLKRNEEIGNHYFPTFLLYFLLSSIKMSLIQCVGQWLIPLQNYMGIDYVVLHPVSQLECRMLEC